MQGRCQSEHVGTKKVKLLVSLDEAIKDFVQKGRPVIISTAGSEFIELV